MSQKPSKFAALLKTRTGEDSPLVPPAPPPKKRGRPGGSGKRLNPQYTQVTAYIPEALHTQTKINLLRTGKGEFSALVEELLTNWNQGHSKS